MALLLRIPLVVGLLGRFRRQRIRRHAGAQRLRIPAVLAGALASGLALFVARRARARRRLSESAARAAAAPVPVGGARDPLSRIEAEVLASERDG